MDIQVFLQTKKLFLIRACSTVWKQKCCFSRERAIWTHEKSKIRDKRKTSQS